MRVSERDRERVTISKEQNKFLHWMKTTKQDLHSKQICHLLTLLLYEGTMQAVSWEILNRQLR